MLSLKFAAKVKTLSVTTTHVGLASVWCDGDSSCRAREFHSSSVYWTENYAQVRPARVAHDLRSRYFVSVFFFRFFFWRQVIHRSFRGRKAVTWVSQTRSAAFNLRSVVIKILGLSRRCECFIDKKLHLNKIQPIDMVWKVISVVYPYLGPTSVFSFKLIHHQWLVRKV